MHHHIVGATGDLNLQHFLDQILKYPYEHINYSPNDLRPNNVWMISPYDDNVVETGRRTIKLSLDQFPEFRTIVERIATRYIGDGTVTFSGQFEPNLDTFMVTEYTPGSFFLPHIDATFELNGKTYYGNLTGDASENWQLLRQWLYDQSQGGTYSLILLLNDQFTGGELSVWDTPIPLMRGDAALFSIYDVHALSKIESGSRYVALFRIKVLTN